MSQPLPADAIRAMSEDELAITTVRTLAIDAVQQANSGHPGLPLGAAPMAHVVWSRHLRFDPADPDWPDRDRFVLSAGHGSMLLYALLHVTGYDVSVDDLKGFRQWESITPGHPENILTPGVEVTTGPLGQGFGNAVGMGMAEAFLAARFNRDGHVVVDHHTYCLVSDGDLMEGVASEAASLAGHLGLGKLIYLYDDNHITIDGSTDLAFTEDVGRRFEAYGWHVQRVADGNDLDTIDAAVIAAKAEEERPSLIMVRTHIGYGSPNKQDSAEAHGAALGVEEVALTKEKLGWSSDLHFFVPDQAREFYGRAAERGRAEHRAWKQRLEAYERADGERAAAFRRALAGELEPGWEERLPVFSAHDKPMATRSASGKVLNAIASSIPTLIGGSADLAASNNTNLADCGEEECGDFQKGQHAGRNLHFGVREHGMGAVLNGLALHGGVVPYGATFLIFSDYMRPSIRLASLSEAAVIYLFTHDSVGLGEDGPTHQPIEHLASLRAMPRLQLIRPGDANETAAAWKVALERRDGPVALALTRQNLPIIDQQKYGKAEGLARGAYILAEAAGGSPQAIIIGTGSEVSVALAAQQILADEGIGARVVSMPCWELFQEEQQAYRDQVLPPDVTARVAVEAAASFGWERWVGERGKTIGIDRFGASAPGATALERLGITPDRVAAAVREVLR
jgi:transketolase